MDKPEDKPDFVIISWETAEYLSVLIGHNIWGNQERRGKASAELGSAMKGYQMSDSRECFLEGYKKNK